MGKLTRHFPKALLPVAGRPILSDLADQLARTGRFDQLVVVTNHRDHRHFVEWREALLEEPNWPSSLAIRLIDDGTMTNSGRLGAIGDLALAVEIAELKGPLLVAAGDNLFRFDLNAYLEDFDRATTSMVLVSPEPDVEKRSRSGIAEVDETGRLRRLWEKPKRPPSELCCPPLYVLNAEALAEIESLRATSPEADAPGHLIAWIAERCFVRTHRMRGERLDVGDAESYARAGDWLRSQTNDGVSAE
jgi:glucose-1-phosphate thymidylyltransferase